MFAAIEGGGELMFLREFTRVIGLTAEIVCPTVSKLLGILIS
jgi:hypothetical protein